MPKIVVLMKQVIASDAKINVNGGRVDENGVSFEVNPYDMFAGEAALQLKETLGGDTTTAALCFGPERAEKGIKDLLAVGHDEAYRVWDDAFETADNLGMAKAIAAAVKKIGADLVLTGKETIDDDNHALPVMVAEFLGWPSVTAVSKLDIQAEGTSTAKRDIEGATEVVEFSLPAVVSTDKGLNQPRYPSLKGIMKVKKKQIPVWGPSDIDFDAGALDGGTTLVEQALPPARSAGKIIEGDSAEAKAKELAKLLREEAKVI